MIKLDTVIWITWHTPWVPLTSAIFHPKSANFAISRNTCKDWLDKKVTMLMMSAKMATPGLLKIKVFWNKGCDVILYVDDVTNKILSRDSKYIVDVVMWPKFGNSSISMTEVIITWKTAIFEGWSWFKFNNLGLALGMNLKFYTSVEKGLKLKVRKLWGIVPESPHPD